MLRLIDRYLLRQLFSAFVAVTILLMLILVGGVVAETLNNIVRGKIPASLLLSQIALRSLDAGALMLPLAAFLAVMIAFGRLYRDSEMAVLAASGLRTRDLLRPLALLVIPLTVVLVFVRFWLSPLALDQADTMVRDANRSLLLSGLEPGRFVDMPGRFGVVYVGEMNNSGTQFKRLFLQHEKDGRLDIITAAEGQLFYDQEGAQRYLSLSNGFRVEGGFERADFRTISFKRNDIQLPEPEAPNRERAESKHSFSTLWRSQNLVDRAELQWRLSTPLSLLILVFLALPLAKSVPREPRYGRIIIAVTGYLAYANFLALGRGWIATGKLPESIGLWWIHFVVLLLAYFLLRAGETFPKSRSAR